MAVYYSVTSLALCLIHVFMNVAKAPAAQNARCLQTNGSIGLPFFQGYTGPAGAPPRRIHHQNQAIIPSYKFKCCGNITEWGVDLNPEEGNASFTFDFQVWRPSPTVNEDGCYSLVNNYIVRSTSLPIDPAVSHVARVTPLPQNQLQFQPGDVLGFYVESQGTPSDHDNGVVFLNNGSHTSELVWHARIDEAARASQSGSCPYPVGTNGVLQTSKHAAPVISLSITAYSCSPSPTNHLPHSSPTFIQSTATTDVYPGNRSSTTVTSTISLRVLILGVTLPVIILAGGVVTVTVLVAVVIRMHKTSTNASHESNNNEQLDEVQYVYDYPAINTALPLKLKSNVAYATHSDSNKVSLKPNVAYATHSKRI